MLLKKNDYPLWAITQLMKEVEETQKRKDGGASKSARTESLFFTITIYWLLRYNYC